MRMNGNDLAACAVIALGVGGVVVGSLLGVGNQAVTLPAVNPQPVVVDMPAEPEPTATPEPTPEPTPTVETVHFSATGDDLIHAPPKKITSPFFMLLYETVVPYKACEAA